MKIQGFAAVVLTGALTMLVCGGCVSRAISAGRAASSPPSSTITFPDALTPLPLDAVASAETPRDLVTLGLALRDAGRPRAAAQAFLQASAIPSRGNHFECAALSSAACQ